MAINELYLLFLASSGICTDTRKLQSGVLYVALKGDNFDGNDYVAKALEQGASHAISSDASFENRADVTVVSDTLKTLQELASYHRKELGLPVIGLTGSNGKTTTKELILSILSQSYKVKGTVGNLNNHIGVPLTLLSFDKQTEIGVVEMGANHQGEIAALSQIADPDYGLITNFGKAHLEGFGGIEGVKKGKSELYKYLNKHHKTAIVLHSDDEQLARTKELNRIFTTDLQLLEASPIQFNYKGTLVKTQLTGAYNFNNMLLAIEVGEIMKVPKDAIIKGLESYSPTNNRSQLIKQDSSLIILDAYNANPTSMRVALENLAQYSGTRTAILGDMFELGDYARIEHQSICDYAEELDIENIILIGANFVNVASTKALKLKSIDDIDKNKLLDYNKDQTILIKGSRGMALERLIS
ncbi:UDP-N-acetylmuramoyl-tripeptide--D-alanyl-D-alanine ligase [Nonlabens ponticola]|uniref:UDP-N-acetylmuramoyl-tripeptide--D-alanyl-D-alanine ligase n=1 Tax=Nonlabens ponticola TaxID=2496866 RepID=A0A3S9MWX3_9FLAO|nr:UDP-N-acetylmuramoyl-tripeptide--D-alanyl-D-alanine ligase [Nonlabens ponticola]AZQ43623.1 UDP-N-acetylmuramoyl-tripeptide--D-alanyl-D-alanine ligase [Nonlabens ponticola]